MLKLLYILSILVLTISPISFSSEALPPKKQYWPFEGMFGTVDREAAQRGFKVYKEVCAVCHGLEQLSYRNLEEIGFSEAEVKNIAKEYEVQDGPNDEGEMFIRPGILSDRFANPFRNEQAARAANNGAYPVDLSLIIKARPDGPNYVYSLLTGYRETPKKFYLMSGLYYNPYFPGQQIAMPPPLSHGQVSYPNNASPSIAQMSRDLVIFLQWAAEPEMENRKSMGLKVLIYLIFFTIFFYIANKRLWSKVK